MTKGRARGSLEALQNQLSFNFIILDSGNNNLTSNVSCVKTPKHKVKKTIIQTNLIDLEELLGFNNEEKNQLLKIENQFETEIDEIDKNFELILKDLENNIEDITDDNLDFFINDRIDEDINSLTNGDGRNFWEQENASEINLEGDEFVSSEIDTLKLFYRDVKNFEYKVDKSIERVLLQVYSNIRNNKTIEKELLVLIPSKIYNYVFGNDIQINSQMVENRITEIILLSNAKLLTSNILSKLKNKNTGLQVEDLISSATAGFIRGLKKYDITKINQANGKPYELSTYLVWWIRQALDNSLINQKKELKLPTKTQNRVKEYFKTFYFLRNKLGSDPTTLEVATHLDMPEEYIDEIKTIIDNFNILSLDTNYGDEDGNGTLLDFLEDPKSDFVSSFRMKNFFEHIEKIMNTALFVREKNILLMRFRVAPYDNPGKTIEETEKILRDLFEYKKDENGVIIEKIKYNIEIKFGKKEIECGKEITPIVGLDLCESPTGIDIDGVIKTLRKLKFYEFGFLRVIEDDTGGKNNISIHLDSGKPATLREIGREFNMSRERARQIISHSLDKLLKYCHTVGVDINFCQTGKINTEELESEKKKRKEKREKKKENICLENTTVAIPYYYDEIAKNKKTTFSTVSKINENHKLNCNIPLVLSNNLDDLKEGMIVENLKRKSETKLDKASGKMITILTSELTPYRVGKIVKVLDKTLSIELESGEVVTVMKNFVRPLIEKK